MRNFLDNTSHRHESDRTRLGIAVVDDGPPGQLARKLEIYRFFNTEPRIVLVSRRQFPRIDVTSPVHEEVIHLPVLGLDGATLRSMLAFVAALGYLTHSFLVAHPFEGCLALRDRNVPRLANAGRVGSEGHNIGNNTLRGSPALPSPSWRGGRGASHYGPKNISCLMQVSLSMMRKSFPQEPVTSL
jgi:hypothetical protein